MTTTSGSGSGPDQQSIGQLISRLSEQAARLVRAEIDLAKAELAQKAKAAGIGIGLLAGAAFFGFFTFAVLVTTVILAISEGLAPWLAALIVLVALAIITGVLALVGVKSLQKGTPPTPQKAVAGLKQDAATVQKSVKEGLSR
ncbi:phage holin family protein [Cellulomonas sp. PS-H5]|uniref:phage holin family protein n=1 Tax=Cellulomonas sp. PS-H5 TaxID=2820400 RepID=UPI001C4EEA42|nr:phage holin family protein [Cellulomonas sp. PS-H5]MBW0252972.1 phage holin family protein [Cellulomonas sp. PS-H5]